MTESSPQEQQKKSSVVIFHTAHPFSPTGIHSGAEMGTIHLARALACLGAFVKVIGRITSGSGDYDGVWYEDLGSSFDVQRGLSRITGEVDVLISITRADVLEASLEFPAIKKRMLWMQDSDIALTRADAPRINACADRVVYVSNVLRRLLEQQGIAPEKGVVIHNGYDPSVFHPRQVQADVKRIMFAGALVPEKGIQLLIEAFNILSLRDNNAELWIYGSETLWGYRQSFDQKRISFNNPRIHFAGKVTQQQLGEAYSRAAFSVIPSLPSKRLDPFPLTSIEAQASGCPVVVSTCGGLPEGVADGVSGVVFKGEDANSLAGVLEGLLSDPTRLQRMREAALNHVQGRFTWEVIAGQFLNAATEAPLRSLNAPPKPGHAEPQRPQNILVVYEHIPAFDRTGGDFYAYSLFRSLLATGNKITMVARDTFADPGMTEHYRREYTRLGIEVHFLEQIQTVNGEHQRFRVSSLDEIVGGKRFDTVLIFWWHIAQQFGQQLRQLLPSARIVVNSVDVAYMRLLRQAALHDNVEEWNDAVTTRRNELNAYAEADTVLAITQDDEALLRKHLPGKHTAVVPYIHNLNPVVKGYDERRDLVFVAFFEHRPNADAAQFFASKVFPTVRKRLPGVKLYLVGSAPPAEVKALACKDIFVTGFVPELKPYLQQARVSVVPLRYGAGMKGKIGQSLCEGVPVVTTSIGSEGMNMKDGEHVLIADDAEAFANAVVRLYEDRVLWETIVRQGRQVVHERWSEERVGARLLDALHEAKQPHDARLAVRPFPIIEEEEKLSRVATGHDWFQQKFNVSAQALFAESVNRHPELASGYVGLAMCAQADSKNGEVIRLASLAAERSAESSGVTTWEGLALKEEGKLKPAAAKLRQAIALQPSNLLALRSLADLLRNEGRPKEAFECYRQLLQKSPTDLEALMSTAAIAREIGHRESAINLLQGALRSAHRANDPVAARQIGQSLRELSRDSQQRNAKTKGPVAGQKTAPKENPLEQIAATLTPAMEKAADAQSLPQGLTSIIILTYNNLDVTKKCIESVQRNTRAPHEIIVVDNNSTDGTRRWLEEMNATKRVHGCILNKENVGFPAGVNQGINAARGQYLLLLNNDTVVTKGWLEKMIEVAESDPAVAIVGPMSNMVSGVQMDTTAKYKSIAAMHEHAAGVARTHAGITLFSPRVAFLCTLIKREAIDAIGGLDERFTPGNFEDDDFCLRAQLTGFKTVIARDVFIHHIGSKSFGADGQEAYTARIETNRKVFIGKWGADPIEIWNERKAFTKRNPRYPLNRDAFAQHFERAKILIEEKEMNLALSSLLKAVAQFHSSERKGYTVGYADVVNLTGNVALIVNDVDTAVACYEKELGVSSNPARATAGLEKARSARERLAGTQNAVTAPASGHGEGHVHPGVQQVLSYATVFNHSGNLDDAIKILQEGIRAFPDNALPYSTLAWLLIQNKMYEEASSLIQSTPDTIKRSIEWLEIAGFCSVGQGLDDVALQCAAKALELSPASTRALTLKGILLSRAGNPDEAKRLFELAIKQSETASAPHHHLGMMLWRSDEQEEGLNHLKQAFILDPTDPETLIAYYGAAESLGRLEEARALFEQASTTNPVHKKLKHCVADVLSRQEKYAEAMGVAEDAITLFGAGEDIMPFAREVRKTVGPKEIVKSGDATVSLCMIVKNEEQFLARCLSSVKTLVDEIVVVDTGSTDKTRAIAEAFGAKVFEFSWTESFSDARNFSLSKASGNWILVLDGDEIISPADHDKLKALASSGVRKRAAYSFTTRNYVTPTDTQGWIRNDGTYPEEAGTGWIRSDKARLFPRHESVKFRGAVHELVESSLSEAGIELRPTDIPIHHYGKLNIEKSRDKGENYRKLGKTKLEEAGASDVKSLSELAIQENELGNHQHALEIWLRVVELDPRNSRAHMGVGSNYIGLGQFENAVTPLKTSIGLEPGLNEAYIRCSVALLALGRASEAIPLMTQLVRLDPTYPYSRAMLAAVHFCTGDKNQGMSAVEALKRENVTTTGFFADLARQMKSHGRADYAIAILEPLYESGNINEDMALLLVESYKTQVLVA